MKRFFLFFIFIIGIFSIISFAKAEDINFDTTILDVQGPSKPLNLRATEISQTSITLQWDISVDNLAVSDYKIYDGNTNNLLATTINATYTFTGLSPDIIYLYYVKAFDEAGNLSDPSSVLSVRTLKTTEEGSLVMSNVPAKIRAGDQFPGAIKITALDKNGSVSTTYTGAIYFSSTDLNANLVWNVANNYTFIVADQGVHNFSGADFKLNTVGDQKLIVTDGKNSAQVTIKVISVSEPLVSPIPVAGVIEKIINFVKETINKITQMFEKNKDKINTIIITTTATITTLLMIPMTVSLIANIGNIVSNIIYWLLQFFELIGIRPRRKPWGTIFNSDSGKHVAKAIVRIFDSEYNRLLDTEVTDSMGRFGFLVKKRNYFIKVNKSGFSFPSKLKTSEFFDQVYLGEKFYVKEDQVVTINIPIDPLVKKKENLSIIIFFTRLNRALKTFQVPLMSFGICLSIISVLVYRQAWYLLVFIYYALLLTLRFIRNKRARSFGVVADLKGNPIGLVVVRIFNDQTGTLLGTEVTDRRGRFKFLVNAGQYFITAKKNGFFEYKSSVQKFTNQRSIIVNNIILLNKN